MATSPPENSPWAKVEQAASMAERSAQIADRCAGRALQAGRLAAAAGSSLSRPTGETVSLWPVMDSANAAASDAMQAADLATRAAEACRAAIEDMVRWQEWWRAHPCERER